MALLIVVRILTLEISDQLGTIGNNLNGNVDVTLFQRQLYQFRVLGVIFCDKNGSIALHSW